MGRSLADTLRSGAAALRLAGAGGVDGRAVRGALADGAVVGLAVWGLEVAVVVAANAGIGGWSVLAALRDELAAWGLAYAAFGALAGLGALVGGAGRPGARVGRLLAAVPWFVLVAFADDGVAPPAAYVALVIGARIVGWAARRAPARVRDGGLLVAAGGLVAGAFSGVTPPAPAGVPGAGPDVVLVVVDTLRADHVGAWGYARGTTPNLDVLATEGARFSQAWSTSSWTLPAHASLFTGLPPAEHGATESHPLLVGGETLAERFTARGYRTVGLSANAWVSGGTGLDRGFQQFRFLGDDGIVSQLLLPLVFDRAEDLGGRAITAAATDEIAAAAAAGEPLFLFVNYLEAHEPLGTLPAADLARFATGLDPDAGRRWMRDMPLGWCACGSDGTPTAAADTTAGPPADPDALVCRDGLYRASPARIQGVVDRYDAGIAYVDARLGELRDALARAGRLDDTLFVVTSDHGEHLGEDGRLGHMVWLDDPLLAIPLVARFPGRLAPGSVEAAPIDLAWLSGWIAALAAGDPLPALPTEARAAVGPHPAGTIEGWEAVYGCDFTPAATGRRAVTDGSRRVRRDGAAVTTLEAGSERPATPEEIDWVDARGPAPSAAPPAVTVPAATREALEAVGYLAPGGR